MKKTCTLLFLGMLGGITAIAQPTLTASTSTPPNGLTYQVFGNSTFLSLSSGASQTWDFSAQSFTSAGTLSYETCNAANNCSAFPGTSVVGNSAGSGGGYLYYIGSSSALSVKGLSTTAADLVYSDPEDLYRFPMAFGSNYVDPWKCTFTSGGINFVRSGNDTVSADGWGTLKTPAGTYTNALRIKRIQTYKDSANILGSPYVITYKAYIYTWNDLTHKDFIYTTSSLTTTLGGSPSTSNFSRYTNNQVLGIESNAGSKLLGVTVFPNPGRENVQVSMRLNSSEPVALSLIDLTGRIVVNKPAVQLPAGDNKILFPISGLSAGIYTLRVIAAGSIEAVKLVVE